MNRGAILILAVVTLVIGCGVPSSAPRAADKARIGAFSDVNFGTIAALVDRSASESVCAYTSSATSSYSVNAIGSGTGGAFTLTSGAADLPYEALWADSGGQTGGTPLIAGSTIGGFISTTNQQSCNSGAPSTASLTIIVRSAQLAAAQAGSYAGTLQITIAPE